LGEVAQERVVGPDRGVDPVQEDEEQDGPGHAGADAQDQLDRAGGRLALLARAERLVLPGLVGVLVAPAAGLAGAIVLVVRPAADVVLGGAAGLGHGQVLDRSGWKDIVPGRTGGPQAGRGPRNVKP